MHQFSSSTDDSQIDFGTLLEQSFEELEEARRGDILSGVILAIDKQGIIVDLGLKRDGVVLRSEFESLGADHPYVVGHKVTVMVIKPEDQDGNLVVSIFQARASEDWEDAQAKMDAGELYNGQVASINQGGLIVPFGDLRGFVPASHVLNLPRGLDDEARAHHLSQLIGKDLTLKIIEVNPQRRRLVFSQREAQREARNQAKERLLDKLKEGDIVQGTVSSLRDFGAFVDLGGADGLIHVSELAWRRVRHPGEILSVGMAIEAYVLQLDQEGKRIGLSLKRLETNPWADAEQRYRIGQEVEGKVSRVVSFGAFVELTSGIEALLHVSQMGNPPPAKPDDVAAVGDHVVAEIIAFEPDRQRMGLALKSISGLVEAADDTVTGEDQPVEEGIDVVAEAEEELEETLEEAPIEEPVVEADMV
ncbi:MAG: S1 RNA-binding domain-containing protein [Anaerolineae bacterium]|nr:S1 RNA-binding domain-containing protein [Anaerolineae bacterium]